MKQLFAQQSFEVVSINETEIIIRPEIEYNSDVSKEPQYIVSLTNINSAIKRGCEIGHLNLGNYVKEITTENLWNIHIEGDKTIVAEYIGFGSNIKSKQQIQIAINASSKAYIKEFYELSKKGKNDLQDMGKLELANTKTRGFVEYEQLPVKKLQEGTKVRVNGVIMGTCDGHGFVVQLTKEFKHVRPSMFQPTIMPPNVISHLKGWTQQHTDAFGKNIKRNCIRVRKSTIEHLAGYDSYSDAYVTLQKGRKDEQRPMLFAASYTKNIFKESLIAGVKEKHLNEDKVKTLLSLTTFKDQAVGSMAGQLWRTALTGGYIGVSRVAVPCYDIPVGQIGLSDKKSGLHYIGVRQPVISVKNVPALTSKQIQLPRYVTQYRVQLRNEYNELCAISKGILSEVEQCEILNNDGTIKEIIDYSCLIIGEKDIAMGELSEYGQYDAEFNIVNRYCKVGGMNPEYLNLSMQLDFDGDLLQIFYVEDYLHVWNLILENWNNFPIKHTKVAKVKRPWTDTWKNDTLYHLTYSLESGRMMGIFDNIIELLSMFDKETADQITEKLLKEFDSSQELLEICKDGYQQALDMRKRIQDGVEEIVKISRRLSGQFYKIPNNGHLKSDPSKFNQGWFSHFEPNRETLQLHYDDVRKDYPPYCMIQKALERNKTGQFKNWIRFLKRNDISELNIENKQYETYKWQDFMPNNCWTPNRILNGWVLLLMKEINSQERYVQKVAHKDIDMKGKEIAKYSYLEFIQEKRYCEINKLFHDTTNLLSCSLEEAKREVMLTSFYIDNNRRNPRDNREFTVMYFQPELAEYMKK